MGRTVSQFLGRLIPGIEQHLSDDRLASLSCGDLPLAGRWIARTHIANCWPCRLRQHSLEGRADRMLEIYNDALDSEELPLPDEPIAEFSRKLTVSFEDEVPQRVRTLRFPKISLPEFPPMSPALVTCMVFGFATILSFGFWWQQRAPRISSNTLLVRAEEWDTPNLASNSGVVYQSVRITMSKQSKQETKARAIYRDMQSKRRLKQAKLDVAEEQLKSTLVQAGVDWNEPLSASDYQSWHDHQHVREDNIVRAGSHLLRLTTTVPDGLVADQSLIVRDTDFHPVKRTVAFRDKSTIEIAELDFKLLPWSAVGADIFEPIDTNAHALVSSSDRVLPFPRLPFVLSEDQLDEAELGVRLALNQLHADSSEPIEIHRSPGGITVSGVVETEARKRDLESQLRMMPHVTSALKSAEHLRADPSAMDPVVSIATASMPDQPSPLKVYLQKRGHSVADINGLEQRIFVAALTISQEAREIADLETRFNTEEHRTTFASATLSELIYSHHERLRAALKSEREVLAEVQSPSPAVMTDPQKSPSLADTANRNLLLSKELTQTHSPGPRSAERILEEMSLTTHELALRLHDPYGKSQAESAVNGKK